MEPRLDTLFRERKKKDNLKECENLQVSKSFVFNKGEALQIVLFILKIELHTQSEKTENKSRKDTENNN